MRRLLHELPTSGPTIRVGEPRAAWDVLAHVVADARDRDAVVLLVDQVRRHVGLAELAPATTLVAAQRSFAVAHAAGLRLGVRPPRAG